jgi:uncharacterized protein YecE (DUF72 family)
VSSRIRIGISGWRYAGWRGVFYPQDLPQRRELEYASRRLTSIEINGSFYSLQTPESFARWYAETPDDFLFSVKGGRYITHMLRLKEVDRALANFFASGVLALREKLGAVLWQLPPNLEFDPQRLDAFLRQLPHDTLAALDLARRHSDWMAGRADLHVDRRRPLRHALEVRNESFVDEAFVDLLRRHEVALVVADTAGNWPYREDVTSDFLYLRLHGESELYASGYTEEALDRWAQRIRCWADGGEPSDARHISSKPARVRAARDVYCYFDNDAKVRAPFDAQRLLQKLGLAGAYANGSHGEISSSTAKDTKEERARGHEGRPGSSSHRRMGPLSAASQAHSPRRTRRNAK